MHSVCDTPEAGGIGPERPRLSVARLPHDVQVATGAAHYALESGADAVDLDRGRAGVIPISVPPFAATQPGNGERRP